MKLFLLLFLFLLIYSCNQQNDSVQLPAQKETITFKKDTAITAYYKKNINNHKPSKSIGNTANGTMENGKLLPFYGENFSYFDKGSYLDGRAFVTDKVLKTILAAYSKLEELVPNRHFYIMETANKTGGKLAPHRTHQNGLSVDFMMPLIKENKPYYGLDNLGTRHYLLSFNNKGEYGNDTTVKVDFNLIAQHILLLNEAAEKVGLKVKKVIIKIEYKDALFATEYGKKLKGSGIYIVKGLSKLINALHDEHYHIDFG